MMKRITLAHYYTTPDVQANADHVGDSLDLAQKAVDANADEIVFAGVRFMAETAKILNPNAKVILPDSGSSCSLVEQTDVAKLEAWRNEYADHVHVAYINSSAEHKATADIIVTSRIVDDVIRKIYKSGKKVIFSPDYNMGAYLNTEYGYEMPLWTAVCEVHDKFNKEALDKEMKGWTDGPKYVLAHPESPLPILKRANYVGSTHGMLAWVKSYPHNVGTIWVATEDGLLYNMRELRPELDIRQAPIYTGCQCNVCPFMKLNTVENMQSGQGEVIDYLSDKQIKDALLPIQRMMKFNRTGIVDLS